MVFEKRPTQQRSQFDSNSRSTAKALVLLGIATFLVGSGNIAQIKALDHVGPFTAVTARSVIAVIALLPFVLRERRAGKVIEPAVLPSVLVAALYFAVSIVAQQIAAQATTATNLGFLINMSAVFVPLLLWFITRKKPVPLAWPVAVLAVIGAWLVTGAGAVSPGWGEGLCLIAGLLDAVWIIALAYAMPRCRAPAQVTFVLSGTVAVLGAMGAMFEEVSMAGLVAAAPELLWLGLMTSAAGFLLSNKAQETLPECLVAVMFCAEAIVSAGLGQAILGETLAPVGYAGAVIITVAILLLQMAPKGAGVVSQDENARLTGLERAVV